MCNKRNDFFVQWQFRRERREKTSCIIFELVLKGGWFWTCEDTEEGISSVKVWSFIRHRMHLDSPELKRTKRSPRRYYSKKNLKILLRHNFTILAKSKINLKSPLVLRYIYMLSFISSLPVLVISTVEFWILNKKGILWKHKELQLQILIGEKKEYISVLNV